MSRSPSVSRVCAVPFCGTQVPPLPQARTELATLMGVAADRVAVSVAKFSVSFRRNSWPGLLFCQVTKRPGVPSVGGVGPSRSEGKYPPSVFGVDLQIWAAAAFPANIFVRSKPHRAEPLKLCPFKKRL